MASQEKESKTAFAITKQQLDKLNAAKDPTEALNNYGLDKLAKNLCTDLTQGIDEPESNSFSRKTIYGTNTFPERKLPSIFQHFKDAIKDEMLIVLIVAAIVSLILGLLFPGDESRIEASIDGIAILGAVFIVSTVQSINNYSQEKQFEKLNKIKKDIQVKLIRKGESTQISIHELMVGDIIILGTGNQVPADGFYIDGYNFSCDQSNVTGEANPLKKSQKDRKMFCGTYVATGDCTMIATAVGTSSQWGNAMLSLIEDQEEPQETPLQKKLTKLARYIGYLGIAVAILVFVILMIYWGINQYRGGWNWYRLQDILGYFIIAVAIVVMAVPEGLPLAVTMSLAYSLMKMRSDQCLVRYLDACETMGGVTQICSDKTGTLTQNRMIVTKSLIGDVYFDDVIDPSVKSSLHPKVFHLLVEGISRNSLSYLEHSKTNSLPKYIGQPTECALLFWISKLNADYEKIRKTGSEIALRFAFSSTRKRMSTAIFINEEEEFYDEGSFRMYTKGASEIVLNRCVNLITSNGEIELISEEKRKEMEEYINKLARNGLRTFALAFKDLHQIPNESSDHQSESDEERIQNEMENELNLIGICGIEDKVRDEVPNAVKECMKAGIKVRMITGDNILTALNIAKECNIYKEGDIAIEGPEFSQLTDKEIDDLLPKLTVLARSSPNDKLRLVYRLKLKNELVAVTGDGTNDAPALKIAHIGLAMGGGTEVARDAADIIILDDNFSSIVKAVVWGRSVFDNIRKFLSFQLTVNLKTNGKAKAALAIAALSAVVNLQPLTAVQLLWVNMIMDSLGALALATERPTPLLLSRPPKNIAHPKFSLISPEMWKMIVGQAIYQIIVLYGGMFVIPRYIFTDIQEGSLECYSLIFNSFIFCQIFNLIACRKINAKEFNVFEKFFSNWLFMSVLLSIIVCQSFIIGITFDGDTKRMVFILDWIGLIFSTIPLSPKEWAFSVLVGLVGFIWSFILRIIPTPAEKLYKGDVSFMEDNPSALEAGDVQLEVKQ